MHIIRDLLIIAMAALGFYVFCNFEIDYDERGITYEIKM